MKIQHSIRKFDKQAEKYERMRKNHPLRKYRSRIFGEAGGEVLELSIGVGNNFEYYKNVNHLTGVDFSSEMLKFARKESHKYDIDTVLVEADIEALEFEENSFDTIVSSLSFCSYQNPVRLLNKLSQWCRPHGKILLMEHGISDSKSLGMLQKLIDPLSLKIVGCHQKRDIKQLVEISRLKTTHIERFAIGCVYLIWALPEEND